MEKLITEKYNNLLIYAVKKIGNLEDAQDLIQNSYLTFVEKASKENILDPFSYLFGIVKLNIAHYFQNLKRSLSNPQKLEVEQRCRENKYSYNDGEFNYDYQVYKKAEKKEDLLAEDRPFAKMKVLVMQTDKVALYTNKNIKKHNLKPKKIIKTIVYGNSTKKRS